MTLVDTYSANIDGRSGSKSSNNNSNSNSNQKSSSVEDSKC